MSEVIRTILAIVILVGINFGVLAGFPRKRAALIPAAATILLVFTLLTALGSGLVGPFDLRPMLFVAPLTAVFVGIWYLWKIKPKERTNG